MIAITGKPLRYLIGADHAVAVPGAMVEAPYGAAPPPGGIWYCNLYDQTGSNNYGPYLPDTATSKEYGEKVVDPSGPRWETFLTDQLALVPTGDTVEWDNCDGYALNVVLGVYDLTQRRAIRVAAKNPLRAEQIAPPCVVVVIQEYDDAVTAASLHALRVSVGKPDLPLRFVTFAGEDGGEASGETWARQVAADAKRLGLVDVGVTFDRAKEEYGGEVEDFLVPTLSPQPDQPMPETQAVTGADIIARAQSYLGKLNDGPDVPRIAREIGAAFPDLAQYCTEASNTMPWCGDFVAYVLMQFGIRPPPVKDGVGFFFVDRWLDFGTPIPVGQEQPGDVAIFLGNPSPHHVTFVEGNGKYVGGNQSDSVTRASFRRPDAIRRAPTTGAVVKPLPPLVSAQSNFKKCLPLLLMHEGGNDDDPRDPGGRTSRGILQREWDVWRQTHPGLPSDVWQAPQDQVEAIYRKKYWDPMQCDALPNGVDYAVFDYGVNSGIGRAPKVLQKIVGADVDGEVGPLTIAATLRADLKSVVNQICDERLSFLQGLATWSTFGRGWSTRVADVRRDALAMAGTPKPAGPIDGVVLGPADHGPIPAVLPPVNPLFLIGGTLLLNLLKGNAMANPSDDIGQKLIAILPKLVTLTQDPILLKLFSGGAVTLQELLTLPKDVIAIMTSGSAQPPLLPGPVTPDKPPPLDPAKPTPSGTPSWMINLGAGLSTFLSSLALAGTGVMGAPVGPAQTTTGTLITLAGPILAALGVPSFVTNGVGSILTTLKTLKK